MNADLSKLKDIHLPQDVSIWPLAPGWYLLLLLSLIVISLSFFSLKKILAKKALKKNILKELKSIENDYKSGINPGNKTCYLLSKLIKRTLLLKENRETIASMTGKAWFEKIGNDKIAKIIQDNEYKKNCDIDLNPIFEEVSKIIKKKV